MIGDRGTTLDSDSRLYAHHDGYLYIRFKVDGEEGMVPLHRLYAYADGKLDHIRFELDPREIHHIDENKWNNMPENLEALEPEHHGFVTNGSASP